MDIRRLMQWASGFGLLVMACTGPPSRAIDAPADPPAPELVIVSRHVGLERCEWLYWQVDYQLRHEGDGVLEIRPDQLGAKVEALVSNSRVESHAAPRVSSTHAAGSTGLCGTCDVIPTGDEARRCRERLVLQVWPLAQGGEPTGPMARVGLRPVRPEELPTLRIAPGEVLCARLRLEHQHPLYGPFDALLGERRVELTLGAARVADRVVLDRPRPVPAARIGWPSRPPAEFLDARVFHSAPESLHLEAHVPGRQSYRFPDYRGVCHGARMRLTFWYLVAPGTEGQCQVRITQYRDLPSSWKTLHAGEVVERLAIVGRWTQVRRVFRVESEATSLTLDARMLGSELNLGELWIDDIQLEPVEPELLAQP